jgi:hypothetical protein
MIDASRFEASLRSSGPATLPVGTLIAWAKCRAEEALE